MITNFSLSNCNCNDYNSKVIDNITDIGYQQNPFLQFPAVPGVCNNWQFTCGNGDCIPIFLECNGYNNCGDNSDEDHCGRDI